MRALFVGSVVQPGYPAAPTGRAGVSAAYVPQSPASDSAVSPAGAKRRTVWHPQVPARGKSWVIAAIVVVPAFMEVLDTTIRS
jgi:hypothetical protein